MGKTKIIESIKEPTFIVALYSYMKLVNSFENFQKPKTDDYFILNFFKNPRP